jgi:hypothetical protein
MNTTQKISYCFITFFYTHKASFLLEQKYLLLLILRQAALISFFQNLLNLQPNEQNSTLLLILNCT